MSFQARQRSRFVDGAAVDETRARDRVAARPSRQELVEGRVERLVLEADPFSGELRTRLSVRLAPDGDGNLVDTACDLGEDIRSLRVADAVLVSLGPSGAREPRRGRLELVYRGRRTGSEVPLPVPAECPACSAPLRDDLLCSQGEMCPSQVRARLRTLAKATYLDLASSGALRALVQAGAMRSEAELFVATGQQFIDAAIAVLADRGSRKGVRELEASAGVVQADLNAIRAMPLPRVMRALVQASGHGRFGTTVESYYGLFRKAPSIDAVREVDPACLTRDEYLAARTISRWLDEPEHLQTLRAWESAGVNLVHRPVRQQLAGTTVALPTQSSWAFRTDQVEHAVAALGGSVLSNRDGCGSASVEVLSDLHHVAKAQRHANPARKFMSSLDLLDAAGWQPDGPLPSTSPVETMWDAILIAHPSAVRIGSRGPLPRGGEFAVPGALYVLNSEARQIVVVMADNLHGAVGALVDGPASNGDALRTSFDRTAAYWVEGQRRLIRESPLLTSAKRALKPGHPVWVTSPDEWHKAPAAAGIYRILTRRDGVDYVYVGRSQNFRVRPRQHNKTAGLSWVGGVGDGITRIELIPAKAPDRENVWTMADLDEAEAYKIQQALKKEAHGGPRVDNVTLGKNGPPSRPPSRVFVWNEPN